MRKDISKQLSNLVIRKEEEGVRYSEYKIYPMIFNRGAGAIGYSVYRAGFINSLFGNSPAAARNRMVISSSSSKAR
ncbi:MAG: hypothetical protein GEU26_17250 [Nitrososphaeraceae archaeon]|nr:hypothetical protein [Nitrososphaeraceae archaeon]